jgi:hypothetical protein
MALFYTNIFPSNSLIVIIYVLSILLVQRQIHYPLLHRTTLTTATIRTTATIPYDTDHHIRRRIGSNVGHQCVLQRCWHPSFGSSCLGIMFPNYKVDIFIVGRIGTFLWWLKIQTWNDVTCQLVGVL